MYLPVVSVLNLDSSLSSLKGIGQILTGGGMVAVVHRDMTYAIMVIGSLEDDWEGCCRANGVGDQLVTSVCALFEPAEYAEFEMTCHNFPQNVHWPLFTFVILMSTNLSNLIKEKILCTSYNTILQ